MPELEGGLRLSVDTLGNGILDSSLTWNPFVDATGHTGTFPSATNFDPATLQSWRSLRRRGSDGSPVKPVLKRLFAHSRSQTETYGSGHPLGSPTCVDPSKAAGITRPHLTRIVGALDIVENDPPDRDDFSIASEPPTPDNDERVVLVHQVASKDSLPGVALKYGISLADLRRANHLWASDSIHLRKVLYIPLEKASRPPQLTTTTRPFQVTAEREHTSPNTATFSSSDTLTTLDEKTLSSMLRRIPASQLSFFPPSSKPSALATPPSEVVVDIFSTQRRQQHTRYATTTTTPPKTLSSILTSLPIAASTRDTIIARLSFDSSSNTSASDDQELELDDVRPQITPTTPRAKNHRSRTPNPWRTPSNNRHERVPISHPRSFTPPAAALTGGIGLTPLGSTLLETPVVAKTRTSSSSSWIHSDENVPPRQAGIRTVQLEPSPSMQLPQITRSKSRSSREFRRPEVV